MKSLFKRGVSVAISLVSLMSVGCLNHLSPNGQPEAFITPNEQTSVNSDPSPYFDRLAEKGFDRNDMVEYNDSLIIVEGDIAFDKKHIDLGASGLGKTSQHFYPWRISMSKIHYIRLQIHPSMHDWTPAIRDAVHAWSTSGNNMVSIQIVDTDPDIVIYSDIDPASPIVITETNVCARAQFPHNGNPGSWIVVNKDIGVLNTIGQQAHLITHELGHNLGLAHTNENDCPLIPSTPESDYNSIMFLGHCGHETMLTPYDKLAITILYPNYNCLLRYYNPNNTDHAYTYNIDEYDLSNSEYRFQCIEGILETSPRSGGVRFYHFYHTGIEDNFYTTEYDEGANNGYTYKDVIGYVYPVNNPPAGTIPLHRYWSPYAGDHFYTTNLSELGNGINGYQYEGIACYINPINF